jgi:DNA primase
MPSQQKDFRKPQISSQQSAPPMQPQRQEQRYEQPRAEQRQEQRIEPRISAPSGKPKEASTQEKETFNTMLEDLIGTRGAYILDEKLNILGKVPLSELQSTLKSLKSGIYAVVMDGVIDKDLLAVADRANISFLVAMDTKVKSTGRLVILTSDDL